MEKAELIRVGKNESILDIGEYPHFIYLLVEGSVVSYYLNKEGDVYHKNIFLPGQLVGSTVASITQKVSQFALESIEGSVLLKIPYSHYRRLIFKNEDLKNFYIAYLELNWVIEKEEREVSIVLKTASERYLQLLQRHPGLDKRVPLHYIASHLGITPTQLSRIRKSLKEKE